MGTPIYDIFLGKIKDGSGVTTEGDRDSEDQVSVSSVVIPLTTGNSDSSYQFETLEEGIVYTIVKEDTGLGEITVKDPDGVELAVLRNESDSFYVMNDGTKILTWE